jgi:Mg/Co/Ni transporter MgtE
VTGGGGGVCAELVSRRVLAVLDRERCVGHDREEIEKAISPRSRKPITVNALHDQELVADRIAKYSLLAVAGSMLPIGLERLGLDPAVSSAPFVATLVDVTGIVIYFEVAARVLRGTLL